MKPVALFVFLALVLARPARADDGRLLLSEAAEPIPSAVIGLQKSAVPLGAGFAVDTATAADLALALNLGLRYGQAFGDQRLVLGARWVQFVGSGPYSSYIQNQSPEIKSFEPSYSGPIVYGAYGLALGAGLLQVEAHYEHLETDALTLLAGGILPFSESWGLTVEAGAQVLNGAQLRAAVGVRYAGEHFAFKAGAAYVHLDDPILGTYPVVPAVDLSWSF